MFETANLATDHQQLMMQVLKKVATKYGLACLTHEKPFAGVNGSGKHVNWSLGSSEHGNLLDPGDTPHENAQFLVFCAAVIRAVYKHQGLLRPSSRRPATTTAWAPTRRRRRSSRSSWATSCRTCSSRSRVAAPTRPCRRAN